MINAWYFQLIYTEIYVTKEQKVYALGRLEAKVFTICVRSQNFDKIPFRKMK